MVFISFLSLENVIHEISIPSKYYYNLIKWNMENIVTLGLSVIPLSNKKKHYNQAPKNLLKELSKITNLSTSTWINVSFIKWRKWNKFNGIYWARSYGKWNRKNWQKLHLQCEVAFSWNTKHNGLYLSVIKTAKNEI